MYHFGRWIPFFAASRLNYIIPPPRFPDDQKAGKIIKPLAVIFNDQGTILIGSFACGRAGTQGILDKLLLGCKGAIPHTLDIYNKLAGNGDLMCFHSYLFLCYENEKPHLSHLAEFYSMFISVIGSIV